MNLAVSQEFLTVGVGSAGVDDLSRRRPDIGVKQGTDRHSLCISLFL